MQQQGCRAAPGIWHFALLTCYAYCSFFTFLLLLQLILNCSSAVITCCAPAHLHPLPSLAVTSNQHRINCRFAGRKVSLIKRVSKGTIVFMLLSANVSCGDQDRGKGTGRCDGNARRQGTGSRGTPQDPQGQHPGVAARASPRGPDSTAGETTELLWLETAFQGQEECSVVKIRFLLKKKKKP